MSEDLDKFIKKFSGLTEEYSFYDGTIKLLYDIKAHVYMLIKPDGTLEVQDGVTNIAHILDRSKVLLPWCAKVMAQKFLLNAQKFHTPEGYSFTTEQLETLIREAKSAHKERLTDAGEVGTAAHNWIEQWIKCDLAGTDFSWILLAKDNLEERAQNCCNAALQFCKNHNIRWIQTERKVYSRSNRYAGTMDGLARADSCNDPTCCLEQFKDRLTLIDWKSSNGLWIEFLLQVPGAYKRAFEEETGQAIEDVFIIRLGKEDGAFQTWHVDAELAAKSWDAFLKALELSRSMADLNALVDEQKDTRRAVKKSEKAAQKAENLRVKCPKFSKYKGTRKTKCHNGRPCEACEKKYKEVQAEKFKNLVLTTGT